MASRGTYSLDDAFDGCPLTATSSIYPATQATSMLLSTSPRPEEVDALLPWGCEQADQAPRDLA